MARLGVGLREHRVETGDAGVRDEPLRPVEHVLPVVTSRNRAHRGGVGARARLGQRVRGEHLARRESRQPGRALLVRAAELEPERAELLHREDEPARGADLRDLLDRDEREQRSRPGAAVPPRRRKGRRSPGRGRARRRPTGTRATRRSPPPGARSARAPRSARARAARAAPRSGRPRARVEV